MLCNAPAAAANTVAVAAAVVTLFHCWSLVSGCSIANSGMIESFGTVFDRFIHKCYVPAVVI